MTTIHVDAVNKRSYSKNMNNATIIGYSKPQATATETLVEYFTRVDAWKAQGKWVPASGGTETPFLTRSGATLLYCYQPRSGKHAYLDMGTDMILTDDEASALLGRF